MVAKRHGAAHQRRRFARACRVDPLRGGDGLQPFFRGQQHAPGMAIVDPGPTHAGAQLLRNVVLLHHGGDAQRLGCAGALLMKLRRVPIPALKEAQEDLASVAEIQSAHAARRARAAQQCAALDDQGRSALLRRTDGGAAASRAAAQDGDRRILTGESVDIQTRRAVIDGARDFKPVRPDGKRTAMRLERAALHKPILGIHQPAQGRGRFDIACDFGLGGEGRIQRGLLTQQRALRHGMAQAGRFPQVQPAHLAQRHGLRQGDILPYQHMPILHSAGQKLKIAGCRRQDCALVSGANRQPGVRGEAQPILGQRGGVFAIRAGVQYQIGRIKAEPMIVLNQRARRRAAALHNGRRTADIQNAHALRAQADVQRALERQGTGLFVHGKPAQPLPPGFPSSLGMNGPAACSILTQRVIWRAERNLMPRLRGLFSRMHARRGSA